MKNTATTAHNSLVANSSARLGCLPDTDHGRRRFLKLNLLGLALAPTASLLLSTTAWAVRIEGIEDNTPAVLDPHDPQAQALSYMEHSSKQNQSCSNCQLFTGTSGETIGPCAIFSYRVAPNNTQILVNASGWCRAWAPRQPA